MKNLVSRSFFFAFVSPAFAESPAAESAQQPSVIYWDSAEGKACPPMPADAYWQLAPNFVGADHQVGVLFVASAVTVLNAMPIPKPVDPALCAVRLLHPNRFPPPRS